MLSFDILTTIQVLIHWGILYTQMVAVGHNWTSVLTCALVWIALPITYHGRWFPFTSVGRITAIADELESTEGVTTHHRAGWWQSVQVLFSLPTTVIVLVHYGIFPCRGHSAFLTWISLNSLQNGCSTVLVSSHCCASSPLIKFRFIEEYAARRHLASYALW